MTTIKGSSLLPMGNLLTLCSLILLQACGGGQSDSFRGVSSSAVFSCETEASREWTSRTYAWNGRCNFVTDTSGCAYYDLRNETLGDRAGFDQRGLSAFQLTFPATEHLFAALSIREDPESELCWSGGAIVGRNPLAMTWSTDSGTKSRKNNFVQTDSGILKVEGVRIHNTHDTFLATTADAGFDIRKTWVSWNRDDFFEGQLHRLSIDDSLIDGTYNFLSDSDNNCIDASDQIVTIKNSLIRIQEQPGPYGGHTNKWHWQVEGGHNLLYKLDSCDWDRWPQFVLVNNVFFIEGPYTSKSNVNHAKCNLALPGECGQSDLPKLMECSNNVFLYSQYEKWAESGESPGPVPLDGGRYFNSANPEFLLNNQDCYQRMTDDPDDAGYGNVQNYWDNARAAWIAQNSSRSAGKSKVMQIPGIDYSVLSTRSQYRLRNAESGYCVRSNSAGEIDMVECGAEDSQWFSVVQGAGALSAGINFRGAFGGYLRTQNEDVLQRDQSDDNLDLTVFSEKSSVTDGTLDERWYVLPAQKESPEATQLYIVESDAIRRSFLKDSAGILEFQKFYGAGAATDVPQQFADTGNFNSSLLWEISQR